MRLDSLLNLGGPGNHPALEDAADHPVGDLLRSPMAHPRGLSTLVPKGTLAGSPAEGTTSAFLWVILPIVAVPWGYVFVNYIYNPKK